MLFGRFLSQAKPTHLFSLSHGARHAYLLTVNMDDIISYTYFYFSPQRIISSLMAKFAMTRRPWPTQLFFSRIAYSDADWAGCPATRRSTSGYCVFLGDNLLTWSFKLQDTLSRSNAGAEYRGVSNAVAETSWIRNLLRELHTSLFTTTLVYCDNVSVVYMSANPVQHQRTKHIEIGIHFVRDKVAAGHVRVLHVPSRFQYAYIFTKKLPYPLFTDFRSSLSVHKSPAPTTEAY
ncbi:ribonuclease H-like domain-containing protein [Tanacetum coccineum]